MTCTPSFVKIGWLLKLEKDTLSLSLSLSHTHTHTHTHTQMQFHEPTPSLIIGNIVIIYEVNIQGA